jgi:hypothetical protein
MSFKDEWAKAAEDKSEIEEEVLAELLELFRNEETFPSLKVQISKIILEHLKKDKSNLPLIPDDVNAMTDSQLLKIVKERSRAKSN